MKKQNSVLAATVAILLFSGLSACKKGAPIEGGPAIPMAQFEADVEKSTGVYVVDFWATWCGPCRTMKPIFEKVEKELVGKAKFLKVDVDQNQELAQRFNIEAIPTLVLFKDGKPVETKVGVLHEAEFKAWIESQL